MATVMMVLWTVLAGALQATAGRLAAGWNLPLLELTVLYYGLSAGMGTAIGAAVTAALVRDVLSAAPLGAGLVPLILVAVMADACRDHVFRKSAVTWVVCGLAASALSILAQLIITLVVFGRGTAVVMPRALLDVLTVSLAGAVAGPVVFACVETGNRVFGVVPTDAEG